jgi:osmotically-inducible protein OsmY
MARKGGIAVRTLPLAAATGALLAYFLDPQSGRARRHLVRDRALATVRRAVRRTQRSGRGVVADGYGLVQKAAHLRERDKPQPDDATLADKVQSEAFRNADVPKGNIVVNAEDGVVVLRGEVDRPELIAELERRVRNVQGVRDVENLLHLPGAEPKMHQAHGEGG